MAADGSSILDDLYDLYKAGKAGVQSATSGALTGVANLGEMAGHAANTIAAPFNDGKQVFDGTADKARQFASELAADADATRASISAHGQQARADSQVSGNLFKGEVDFGRDPSALGYALNITEGLGSLAPTVATALLTRGRSLRTQAGVGAAVGGITGGGFAAQSEGQHVRELDAAHLAALPAYQQGIAAGLTPDAAREQAARAAERGAFLATAPVSAVGDAATGALFGHQAQRVLSRAVGGSRAAQTIASGLVDSAKEGVQETAEGVTQIAGAVAGTGEQGRDLGEGSAQNFVLGAATGAGPGTVAGATGAHADAPRETAPTAPGPGSPQSQAPLAPAVVDPSRGVLSRAVAAGAAEGHLPHVHVVGRDFLGAAADGLPPPVQPVLSPQQVPGLSPEIAQFAQHAGLTQAAQAAERGMPYVNPALGASIKPWAGKLAPHERLIEAKAAEQVLADPDAAVAAYDALPGTDGGRIISTDEAREIFPEYGSGPEGRSKFALAVHEPSSFVAKEAWVRRLEQPVAADREPRVVFTAGGTGAGKTTAIKRNPEAAALQDSADLIYDGNLQSFPSAVEKIEQAKESGRRVDILYVHRDPVDAFANGAIPRANKESYGRTVPIEAHANTHIGAAKTILQLAQHYQNDPLVSVSLVNNTGDETTPLEQQIAGVANMEHTALKENLHATAQQLHAEGKLAPRVADYYFPADARAGAGEPGAQPVAAGGAGPAGGDGAAAADGQSQPEGGQAGVAFLGSKAPTARITAAGEAPASAARDIHDLTLERDGQRIGEAQVYQDRFGDAPAWHLGFVGLDPEHRGGNGAAAIRAAANEAMARDQRPDHVTAEAMSKKSLRAMLSVFGQPVSIGNDIRELTVNEALDELPADANDQLSGNKVFVAFKLPTSRKLAEPRSRPAKTGQQFGVIVAPKPGTKVTVDGETRPYQRGTDTTLPPAAAPVQRAPDLGVLQERAQAILKRPAALAALRKLFGIKGLQATTIRGSYEGEPELSFALSADGLGPDNAAAVAQFLGMAFAQDAVIVTKPDPVGPAEDSIPTLELYSTDGAKIDDAVFDAVTAELRGQGIDYSEARDGRAIRVLHFGDEAGLESLAVAMAGAAQAHGLALNHLHTRSDLYEAQDYRHNLGEGGDQAVSGQRSALFRALVDHFAGPYARALGSIGYAFDADRYADRFGLDAAERAQLKAALKAAPRPTTALLDGSEPVPARQGRASNIGAGFFLQNRAAALGTIDANDRSAHAKDVLSETFAQEIAYQLGKPEGKQAIGWYDRQLKAALGTIAAVRPEIGSDPNSAFVFKSILAVTSQGLTVEQNFNAALKVYDRYKATGKLDLTGVTLPGKAAPIAKQNVEKVQQLIDAHGLDGAREYLTGMHTVRELKAAGFDPAGKLGDSVRGYFVFGPKIGSFANNLDGDFNTLTADLWFSRTWNRALGSMFAYSPQREVEALRKFRTALVDALNTGGNEIVDGLSAEDRAKIGNLDDDLALAKELNKHFARNGYKDRSPLNRAAKALTENVEALRDVPRGDPERRWQQEVMEETQRKLEQRTGQRISIADLQALLWYQEKELFRLLGAANKASAPLDYQDAAKAAVAKVQATGLNARDDAHIVTTAFPLGSDFLLQKLRAIAPEARVIPLAGTGKALSRVAISPPLDAAQLARVQKIGGVRSVFPGATPSATQAPPTGSTPARFQVPAAVRDARHYAALDEDQQQLVDSALARLKAQGYPAKWLKAASYYFAHTTTQDFVARFYISGETKGAISLRHDRLSHQGAIVRDLAHELAHANDFNPENGGFHSVMSPRLRIQIGAGGSMEYTGDVIAELHKAWQDNTPLADELKYPFAEAEEMGDDITKAEVFAQAVMLYMTHRAALAKHAPLTHAMIEEMFRNEHAATDRGFGALQGALQTTRSRAVFTGAVRSQDHAAGGELDRGEQGRPGARGTDDGHRAGRAGDGGAVTDTPAFKRWFGDSKVVDAAGKPLVVYHGTTHPITAFDMDRTADGAAYFTPSRALAEWFSTSGRGDGPEENVIPAYLSIKNPKVISYEKLRELIGIESGEGDVTGLDWTSMPNVVDDARSEGHDGIHLVGMPEYNGSVEDQWLAFRPEQIKSATGNSGAFDPKNPSMLGARDPNSPASKFLADANNDSMENPFSGRERIFTSPDRSVYYGAVELHSFPSEPKTVWISGIRSFEQGKGYGSYLLGKLTDLADQHGVTLRLSAEPFGDKKPLGKQKLVTWYKRHGFKGTAAQMERAPVTPESPEYLGSRAPGTPPPAEAFAGYTLPSWQLGDHLSSEAGHRLDGYKAAAKAGGDKLRTFLQDYFLPVRRVQEAIAARGGSVGEDSDVYGREELYYGRTGEQLRQIEDDHVKPLVKAMVAAGVKQDDLELYLYAKFAPQRNARIAAINPDLPDGGSGMTNADAAQVLADFDKAGLTAKLEPLAARVRALNAKRVDILEEGGLLSPGEAELWRQEPDYVPLKGFAEGLDKPGATRAPTGQGFSIGGREAHRALGRKSRATDLLANTIAQVEQAVIRAEKNRVATALLRLAEDNPNPDLWTVDTLPRQAVLSPSGEVTYRDNPLHKLADNVVSVKIAGEEHFITLKDERLAASLKNLGAAKMGAFLRAFSAINRTLSLTRTMLAPEFVLANFTRDIQTAAVNLTGEASAAMAARVVKDVPKAMRAMWGQLRNKSGGGEWARWSQEFASEGGMTAFVAQRTVEEQQAHINGLLKAAKGGKPQAIKALVTGTFELIEDVNGAVENATRLSAYANARRSGMSQAQAARLAKNLTVNFNRKGSAGPVINALYLFYNASIQGTARFLHAMKSPKVQGIMAATAVLGYTLAAANRSMGGKDDDGEDKWDKIPEWEKARNLILFLPGGNGEMIKIPLPYTYNLPFLIGSETEGMLHGKRPASTSAANLASAVLTSFNPIGDIDLTDDAANTAAKLVSPTATDPLVEIALNRNFFGAPINPEKSPFDKTPDPDSQAAFPSTSPAARWLANALNTATGGDKLHSGLIDVGPGSLVYVFDYLTGGTGSFVERATTAATLAAQGEHVPANKVPFYRTFVGELSDRRVTDTFYRVRADVNLKAEMAELGRKGEGFDSEGERRDAQLGRRLAPRLKTTERQLAAVRKLRKKAQADGDEAKVKRLEERERAIQLNFNKAYFHALDAQD